VRVSRITEQSSPKNEIRQTNRRLLRIDEYPDAVFTCSAVQATANGGALDGRLTRLVLAFGCGRHRDLGPTRPARAAVDPGRSDSRAE
jgi:hypothetical protein